MKISIVKKNFIFSMLFGLAMGCVFPLYALLFAEFSSTFKLIVFTVGCIIAGLLVGFIAFTITKKTILKVVKRVGQELSYFNSGQLDLTKRIDLESGDEVGDLVREFNKFTSNMGELLLKSQRSSVRSLKEGGDLSSSMEMVNSSVEGIVQSINSVNSATAHQNGVFTNTKEGLDNLNRTVLLLISHVLELFTNMDGLTKELMDQSDTLDGLIRGIESIVLVIKDEGSHEQNLSRISNKLVTQTNNSLKRNLDTLKELEELISKIEDISERTGTLSINASIEAARSGKEGEGFKVIAQEVRKLAEHSRLVSREIFHSISSSEEEISSSVEDIESIMDEYNLVVESLKGDLDNLNRGAHRVKTSSREVKISYGEINGMLEGIKGSLSNLKNDISEYKESLSILENSTESIRVEMEGAKKRSSSISDVASATSQKVQVINRSVGEVTQLLNRFKAGSSEELRGNSKREEDTY